MRMLKFLLLAPVLTLGACSFSSGPSDWHEYQYVDHTHREVADLTRAILEQKFGFRAVGWKDDTAGKLITYSTEWNYERATQAVFSGQGVRRRAWVEVYQSYNEEPISLNSAEEEAKKASAEASKSRREARIEVVDGRRRRLVAMLSIAIERERNVSVIYANVPSQGDWQSAGEDKEYVEQVLASLRDRLNESLGRKFDISERAKAAHERYLRDESLTPEERERRMADRPVLPPPRTE